ncbi:hypothetical protein BGZ47_009060 [Haplosporangium gracile]|nr:hypothetical protein BGZ47_009060 [Haplosporangium gracile]
MSDFGASQLIVSGVQETVREALFIKRRGQAVFYPRHAPGEQCPKDSLVVTNSMDMAILDQLCPRLLSKELDKGDKQNNVVEDGHGEGKKTHFLKTFLAFLYSGNIPLASSTGVAATVNSFIRRLQELNFLLKPDRLKAEIKNIKDFTPGYLVRLVASQLSAELERQYMYGCKELSKKAAMIKKGKLSSENEIKLNDKVLTIKLFLRLNSLTGNKWTIAPLSPVEDGYLTFTEAELGAFFHKKVELRPTLEKLIHHTDKRALTQEDLTCDWFRGYLLRGSIKTDGRQLQVLAFKLRELLSVRYKRYNSDLLPDCLLSTTAGTDDHLTEVRNVFKTKEDVERLLGCTAD